MSKSILILLSFWSVGYAQAGLSRLDALGMIESGDNDAAVGRAGEVSRYQIKPHIWRQYSSSQEYQNKAVARRVAERHMEELQRLFCQGAKRQPSDFDLYVMWNAGPTYYRAIGWSRSRVYPVVRERAQRFVNLRQFEGLVRSGQSSLSPVAVSPRPRPTPLLPPASVPVPTPALSLDGGAGWLKAVEPPVEMAATHRSFTLDSAGTGSTPDSAGGPDRP